MKLLYLLPTLFFLLYAVSVNKPGNLSFLQNHNAVGIAAPGLLNQHKPSKIDDVYFHLNAQAGSLSKVYILYPYNKEKKVLNVFFNKNLIRTIRDGERIVYNLSSEGLLKLTVLTTKFYVDPPTLGKNTRSVSIKNGKDFFFEISGKGELEYLLNIDKAKEKFNNRPDFRAEPIQLTENVADSLFQK